MWGLIIHDRKNKKLIVSRDRFGVKPVYYVKNGSNFGFASEIKQLLCFHPAKANMKILSDYLVTGLIEHTRETFFDGILSLQPGTNLIMDIQTGSFKIQKYYELKPDESVSNMSNADSISYYKNTFQDSIDLRLRADVKVGTCLSGGMDSSWISSVASEKYFKMVGKPFQAFTAKSIEKSKDETAYAKMVVDSHPIEWFQSVPETSDFISKIDEVIHTQEEPFGTPSVFLQYFVLEMAKQQGCIVLLDGQGGDETLLGYERYYPTYLRTIPFYKFPFDFYRIVNNSKLTSITLAKYLVYFSNFDLRKKNLTGRVPYLKSQVIENANWEIVEKMAKSSGNILQTQLLELTSTCLPHLLKYEDKNSMHHSIETRLPFLDYRLVEIALGLKPECKINDGWTKYVSRIASSNDLPDEIRWRKVKFGFDSPDDVWLKDRNTFIEKINESELVRRLINNPIKIEEMSDPVKIWKLYNIAVWQKMFEVQ